MVVVRYPCVPLLMLSLLLGCASHPPSDTTSPRYFKSPQEAVSKTEELLRKQDWTTLALYYDLSGGGIDREELTSGKFFLRNDRPAVAHPGIDWRIREPFPPGFKFDHVEPTDRTDVEQVIVSISIDQGGGTKQRGLKSFLLHKSDRGYQLLPSPQPTPKEQPPSTATENASAGTDADSVEAQMRGSYHPKTTPDTVLDLRPQLADKINSLPSAQVSSIVALLQQLRDAKLKAAQAPLNPPRPVTIPYAGISDAYDPADLELIISELGDRIRNIVDSTPPKFVDEKLTSAGWTQMKVSYSHVPIKHVDVLGSGRFFYAEQPQNVTFMLPKRDTGF